MITSRLRKKGQQTPRRVKKSDHMKYWRGETCHRVLLAISEKVKRGYNSAKLKMIIKLFTKYVEMLWTGNILPAVENLFNIITFEKQR